MDLEGWGRTYNLGAAHGSIALPPPSLVFWVIRPTDYALELFFLKDRVGLLDEVVDWRWQGLFPIFPSSTKITLSGLGLVRKELNGWNQSVWRWWGLFMLTIATFQHSFCQYDLFLDYDDKSFFIIQFRFNHIQSWWLFLKQHSKQASHLLNYILKIWPFVNILMPAPPDQCFEFRLNAIGKLGSEVFLCKLGCNFSQRQLPILPIFCHDFIKQETEWVYICWLFRLEDDIVFITEILDSCIHRFICVSSDQREVFSHWVESTAIENNFLFFNEDVSWRKAAMNHLILM